MRICQPHWQLMRDAVEVHGMSGLVARDGESAVENAVADLQQEPDPEHKRFDPLMSIHYHFTNNAIRCGGLYLMGQREDGENDGHYCPVCEFEKHMPGFVAKPEIDKVAEQMAGWCREQGLIALTT